ncbi:hypothetical protein ACPPVU_16880 [Mucilaginibacter sp. McL0603]|uniref:hypothetical protein n=1 Tax=Mucilaginibacter sp. McL0603 TaxID=3415670 RepID=UPI003CF4DDF3
MRLIFLNVFLALSINVFGQDSKSSDTSFKLTDHIRNNFIKESTNKGRLDYWTSIKGHELEGEKIESDYYVSKGDAAIIKWAYDLTTSGVKDKTAIISLYEELKRRKISNNELSYIDYGYNKALRKH